MISVTRSSRSFRRSWPSRSRRSRISTPRRPTDRLAS